MIKHIVMWRIKDEAEGNDKITNMNRMKEMVLSLKDIIEEIKELEIGINTIDSPRACDIVLYSVFENEAALNRYKIHPEHVKVADFINKIRYEVYSIDYEIGS